MARSYADVMKQIESLSQEAERLKRKEVEGVISRIKEAIAAYGLTAGDLGLNQAAGQQRRRAPASKGKPKASKARVNTVARFRDEAGNTWVGRGPRPHWLREALASGKRLEDFVV